MRTDSDSATAIRLATWNIHGGVGSDGNYDAQRVIAVLRELRADVVALQEVASLAMHGEFLQQLRDALGVDVIAGRTLTRGEGDYGNALLTRYPVTRSANIELAVDRREPRNAIDALLAVSGAELRVVSTHLGLRPAERREQVQRILRAIDAAPAGLTVLMGDINEWFLWGRPLRWLHARFRATPAPSTFPSRRPLFALDRIWVQPVERLRRLDVHRSALARHASDHLPLVAEVSLREVEGRA
ncbi:MAG: endonuclease/exonuclease/phosphatase family protein [Casimicrobiaceae bacterium]